MNRDEIGADIVNMVRMLGLTKERFNDISDDMDKLMSSNPAYIVIYNTVTVNYTEKEQKLIFFIWGIATGVNFGNEL